MSNDPSIAAIAPLRGEFSCATTEIGFLHQQSAVILRDLRRGLLLSSLFYLVFGAADIAALGLEGAAAPLLARLTIPFIAMACLYYARRPNAGVRAPCHAASAFTLLWGASYFVVISYRPGDILLHAMSWAVMAMVIHILIPNRLICAATISIGATLAFLALAWHQHAVGTRFLTSLTMLLICANVFGVTVAQRHARLWREQYWAQQVLTNLSIRDPLTGSYNRRHLNAGLLDGEIARARRYRLSLSLIMCDLDGFKKINDTYGHHAGDEMLRSFATLVQTMTRDAIDTVVRYGGEEFLIILPETRLDGALELAERVRAAFAEQRVEVDGVQLGTTASFGVVGAEFGGSHAVTPQGMIALADQLMYEAKHAGRNLVRAKQLGQRVETVGRTG
ncbi:GGDEF domain-containing protein [Massilia norwichensis]|uniref:diguanylate cyclase n=1 Tax=Massilia norwichensis TaxID=1442366 RepID=A0ABT2A7P3_9BURK|nr:GGDEF domain-containing protein [Massilia norwichensis]MCS0590169.1 GGDEF domain-containing protein [Massilia norwichensis]